MIGQVQNTIDEELEHITARLAAAPAERVDLLQRLLGEGTCRQLGIFPIPEGFKLSIVIPVYNERQWIAELVRRVEVVPIPVPPGVVLMACGVNSTSFTRGSMPGPSSSTRIRQ